MSNRELVCCALAPGLCVPLSSSCSSESRSGGGGHGSGGCVLSSSSRACPLTITRRRSSCTSTSRHQVRSSSPSSTSGSGLELVEPQRHAVERNRAAAAEPSGAQSRLILAQQRRLQAGPRGEPAPQVALLNVPRVQMAIVEAGGFCHEHPLRRQRSHGLEHQYVQSNNAAPGFGREHAAVRVVLLVYSASL